MVDQVPMGYVHSHKEFDPKPSLGAAGAPPQNHSKIAPEGVYFRSFFEWSYRVSRQKEYTFEDL